jgi:hypothetical protein
MERAAALLTAILLMGPTAVLSESSGGSNVVVVQITGVRLPVALPGPCLVKGVVAEVREGNAFAPGQTLTINVPCSDGKPHIIEGPARKLTGPTPMPLDPSSLQRSTRGVAHLNNAGQLDWTTSRNGGQVSGFHILNGAATPVTPAQTPL